MLKKINATKNGSADNQQFKKEVVEAHSQKKDAELHVYMV
jgi:hypothetical protein